MGCGVRRRGGRPDQHRLQGGVPAPPVGRLRRPGPGRRGRSGRTGRAHRRSGRVPRARGGPGRRAPVGAGGGQPHVGRPPGGRRHGPQRQRAALGSGHLHLHRGDDRPVQGLHAQPQLPRGPGPPDRHLLGAHRRRRGLDAAAAVPLQRHRHRRARPAGLRRPGGHLPALLGLQLLVGDEPDWSDHHLDPRHHGLPPGPRRRPARDARVGGAGGQHLAAPARGRAPPGGDRRPDPVPLRHRDLQRGLRGDRGQPHLVAAPGGAQQAERRGGRQRRVLRRPHLRRRRPGASPGHRRRDRHPAQAAPGHVRGLLGQAGGHRRDQPQLVVPHR